MIFRPLNIKTLPKNAPLIAPIAHLMRRDLRLLASCLVVFGYLSGCTTPAKQKQAPPDTIVGNPPAAEEDPFFIRGVPAEAEPVATRGRIEPTEPTDSQQAVSPEEGAPEKVAAAELPAKENEAEELAASGDLRSTAEPEPGQTRPASPKAPEPAQCFSCVQICPAAGDCAQADEDIICGWGTQKDTSEAQKLARAQCDATLDLARQMPVWSRIDGECPPATCR